ncbi:VOC family protein [Methylobacterium indicum]|uniref:Glyoxalase n=1 Tax=Methylobacterium indicum TaxID=1775910 RepID=A0A8H8WY39_9HYPH|nr:VOC family protein [Methylobacterium indicum]BCM86520.1 hypothetical protein mvi_49810 [Methylobacterium indicum]
MRLGYVILSVPDMAARLAFYGWAFGLAPRFVHDSGQAAELETGGTALAFAEETFVAAAFAWAVAAGALPVAAPVTKPSVTKPWGQTVASVRNGDGVLGKKCGAMGG